MFQSKVFGVLFVFSGVLTGMANSGRRKRLRMVFKIVAVLVLLPLLYVAGVLIYGTITDFKPPPEEAVALRGEGAALEQDSLGFLIWNIGFAGLGKDMDFFYDGGKRVRPTPLEHERYLAGIKLVAKEYASQADFFLFQEVDSNARRSHRSNEYREIQNDVLGDFVGGFAVNYNVKFVPLPLLNPSGGVISGLASYSRFGVKEARRYSFPGNFGWPKRLFLLDRCFFVFRIPTTLPGKDLVVINTHNSAYDDGSLKAKQMAFLKNFLLGEYEKGHFVIVGGDWNMCPPNFDQERFLKGIDSDYRQQNIDPEYLPADWKWAYDPLQPTNRKLSTVYDPASSYKTVIDFYLCSPNVEVLAVKGVPVDFAYSDHNPVFLKVRLRGLGGGDDAGVDGAVSDSSGVVLPDDFPVGS